jgi:hypothetical protein
VLQLIVNFEEVESQSPPHLPGWRTSAVRDRSLS